MIGRRPTLRQPLRALFAALLLVLGHGAAAAAAAEYRAAVLVEPSTMTVLRGHQEHRLFPTASMVKMVTLLVVMDAIDAGEISWDTPVEVNREMAWTEGSQVYLKEGEVFPVRDLVRATIIKSANDAAAALAITVAGSQEAFVERMRRKVAALGVPDAEFELHTPHGLPSQETKLPEDRMSPAALARVGAEVLRRPELMEWAGTKLSSFRHGEFQLYNSNHLLRRYDFATGIKTGYHRDAHFCVTASAHRDGMDLLAVVMGAQRKWDSFDGAQELLEWGFDRYRLETPLERGELLGARVPVRDATVAAVPVMAAYGARRVVRRDRPASLSTELVARGAGAPIRPGEWVGDVIVRENGVELARVPAVSALAAPRRRPTSLWRRAADRFWSLVAGLLSRDRG